MVDLIAQHIHTMTLLSVQFTHGCFRILNLKVSSVTDLSFPNSPWLGRTLHWFGKETENVITSCERVYTYKGSHETVVNIAPVELQKKFCYAGLRAHVALFIVKVLL